MQHKTAMILGAGGQDGPFLAAELIGRGFDVICISNRSNVRITSLGLEIVQLDISHQTTFQDLFYRHQPDIVINLLSKSSVAFCESNPLVSLEINFQVVENILKELKEYAMERDTRVIFVQASSSEMFGIQNSICSENSPMNPVTVYGKHKLMAHKLVTGENNSIKNFSTQSIIFFNHESEFRSESFVSAKVVKAAVDLFLRGETEVKFGNIQSSRDWGYAGDYMNALAEILERGKQESYVIGSGHTHTVEEMLSQAFSYLKIEAPMEKITIDPNLIRKQESSGIAADSSRIKKELGWSPSLSFQELVKTLINKSLGRQLKNE